MAIDALTLELATVGDIINTVNETLHHDEVDEMFNEIASCIDQFRDPERPEEGLLPEYVKPNVFANVRDMFTVMIADRAIKEMNVGSLMGLIMSLKRGSFIPEVSVGFKQLQMLFSAPYLNFLDKIGAFFPVAEIVGHFFRRAFDNNFLRDTLTWVTVIFGKNMLRVPSEELKRYVASTIDSNMLILFMRH